MQTQTHSRAIRVEAGEQKQSAQVCKLASQTLRNQFASLGLHVQMLSNTCFGALRKKHLGPNLANPTGIFHTTETKIGAQKTFGLLVLMRSD